MANETRFTDQITEVLVTSNANVRFTGQITEVLVSSSSNIRFTSQFVEVLVPFEVIVIEDLEIDINASANVAVVLSGGTDSYIVAINASAVMAVDLTTPQPINVNFSAEAFMTALVETDIIHVVDTLVLTSDATAFNEHTGNTIGIAQSVALNIIGNYDPTNTLALVQNAAVEKTKPKSVLTELDFLQHSVILRRVLPVQAASNVMVLSDAAVGAREAKSILNLTQLAEAVIFFIPGVATNTLTLTQQADLDLVKLLSGNNQLFLTHNAIANNDTNLNASSVLNLNQFALSSLVGLDCLVLLQAPFVSPESSILLPCPLFGDGENLSSTMSLRRSMNGATKTYIKTNSRRRLTYTFRILDRDKSLEFINFVKKHNSDKMKLTNWKGEVWDVNFLTNPFDFVHTGRSAPCGNRTDINIEFEGVKLYG
jgi:hypothetical protein